ncbi:MAG: hypothetical protein CMQ41_07575 [Gammaproteobacteria bacterium]|nr:hypothetical protein [Gammaproteobacteria bacterium]
MALIGPDNQNEVRLQILNADYESFENDPLRSFHNGHTGGSHEQLLFVRNQNPSKYYTNIVLSPVVIGVYDDTEGEFGTSGWGIKLLYGKRRPTEAEWDMVKSGAGIKIPNIGSSEAADTFTNHPVWVRIFCPGGEPAQIRENMQLHITYYTKEVDSDQPGQA